MTSVDSLHDLTPQRWIAIRVDTLASLFTAGLGAYLVYGPPLDPSSVGFSLNMAGTPHGLRDRGQLAQEFVTSAIQ